MKFALKNALLAAAVLASTAAATLPAAAAFLKPKLVVEDLPTGPALAANTSQDLLLRADGDGSAYLYVEQQQGALLTVFDVTDPEHIKLTAVVPTEGHGAYDFVTPIGNTAELVAFRDGSGTAVVDLQKPKSPRLSVATARTAGAIEPLGSSGYLTSSIPQIEPVSTQPRNRPASWRSSRHPRVLASLTSVTRQLERPETGTVFLLADGKVTVVRRLDAERQFDIDQIAKSPATSTNHRPRSPAPPSPPAVAHLPIAFVFGIGVRLAYGSAQALRPRRTRRTPTPSRSPQAPSSCDTDGSAPTPGPRPHGSHCHAPRPASSGCSRAHTPHAPRAAWRTPPPLPAAALPSRPPSRAGSRYTSIGSCLRSIRCTLGFKISTRSIRFRSSRTFPGQ